MKLVAAVLRTSVLAATLLLLTTSAAPAQPPSDLRLSALRAVSRHVERVPRTIQPARSQQANAPRRSWITRHPVIFGAIVGAVAGASIVAATTHAEASPVGFYGGGAVGAMFGWVVSR